MERQWLNPTVLIACLLLGACASPSTEDGTPLFLHEVGDEAVPWTHERFDSEPDKFTFALIADLTGGERERVFDIAVAQLNLLRPELILSVGDLIEGDSPDREGHLRQWEAFDERADRARAPLFYAGGNHDLTNEVLGEVWDERYGRRYYHFIYRDVLFLVLDTEDTTPQRRAEIAELRATAVETYKAEGLEVFEKTEYANLPERSAGAVSAEQSAYFRQVLAENGEVRWTFVILHKPAWEKENEEHFAAIESALADRPYTVFNGHGQFYRYQERHRRDYIQLSTTGGEQFPEYGRSMDHVTLVTVSDEGVAIANLLLEGILDKTGHVPLAGDDVCFEKAVCEHEH